MNNFLCEKLKFLKIFSFLIINSKGKYIYVKRFQYFLYDLIIMKKDIIKAYF